MDVGATNGWRMNEVMPSSEVIQLIRSELPLVQLDPSSPGETAQRWGYANAQGQHDPAAGEIGVISSVTQAFLRQLQPRPSVHRRPTLPVPVCGPRL